MSITSRIKTLLSTRSRNQCAKCKCVLAPNTSELLNNIAHICGENPGSARYDKNQTLEERNSYENLTILCPSCHKAIDDNTEKYTVEYLRQLKFDHEEGYSQNNELDKLYNESLDKLKKYYNFRTIEPKIIISSVPLTQASISDVRNLDLTSKLNGNFIIQTTYDGIDIFSNNDELLCKIFTNYVVIMTTQLEIIDNEIIEYVQYKESIFYLVKNLNFINNLLGLTAARIYIRILNTKDCRIDFSEGLFGKRSKNRIDSNILEVKGNIKSRNQEEYDDIINSMTKELYHSANGSFQVKLDDLLIKRPTNT